MAQEDPHPSPGVQTPEPVPSSKRNVRIVATVLVVGMIIWHAAQTEFRVAQLRADGFSEFVIESTRNHAYFPLIGGLSGAALFIFAGRAIKRTFRKPPDE